MKIRRICPIRVPFLCLGMMLLIPPIVLAQPHQPKITLQTGSKYDLFVSSIATDTAYLRVTTKKGHAVGKLTDDDFLVMRDGDTAGIISCTELTKSSVNDLAITFIMDNSSSMFHSYDSLTKYLDRFIDSLGGGVMINAMTFDNVERKRTYDGTRMHELFIASSEFTEDRPEIKDFWHSYDTIRTDFTPLYEAIIKGLERIIDRRKSGDSLRSEFMVVVTDGADNASSVTIERLSELLKVMPVTLFTINYNSDPDARLNWLSKQTRGDHYEAEYLHELRDRLEYLRRDISSSYKLVFSFPFRGAGGAH